MNYKFLEHELNIDIWSSKRALFESFYKDFYNFIKEHHGEADLKEHHINNVEDFYQFADYYAEGKENCYAMGFAFEKYFLKPRMNGSFANEPEDTFIGYCVKEGKYVDFLNFLLSFFAYWRNDEGCTCFDPYNYADNFFFSSWAALVDTSKLFYFNSDTVYFWHSFRVKYVLDHIPGVMLTPLPNNTLDPVKIAGYEFLGWFNEQGEQAKITDNVVYGKLKRRDFYTYWEKEEKTIKKVYTENYKKVDPR